MKSEIGFLLELVLEKKLKPEGTKLCLERISELEQSLGQRQTVAIPARPVIPGFPTVQQAPSTQRILDEMAANPAPVMPVRRLGNEKIDKETGTVVIPTGNGTMGMKKW